MTCANHPDRENVAFCQNCGKALCKECSRVVGQAVFCEPCLAARLSTAPGPVNYPPPGAEGTIPPPSMTGGPSSPMMATLLGIIPGVGAMYNGQYAKGFVHLIVFALLIVLTSDVNGLFGIFIPAWVIYQIIDANHTARALAAGTPLPNPFGLNEIGERLGFGKSWPAAPPYPPTTPPPPPAASATTPSADPYAPFTAPASTWTTPTEGVNYAVPPGPSSPYNPPPYPGDERAYVPPARGNVPAGALWLIGLGVFFLIGNMIRHFPFHLFTPLLIIGVGVWLFLRRMLSSGPSLADDGTAAYRYRLFSALRGSVWVILVGLIFLFSSITRFSWGRAWPLFIIVAGVMALLERSSVFAAYPPGYPYPPAPPPEPASPAATTSSTSIVPVNPLHEDTHNDQEGR